MACAALVEILKQSFYSWKNRDSGPDGRYDRDKHSTETGPIRRTKIGFQITRPVLPPRLLPQELRRYHAHGALSYRTRSCSKQVYAIKH
jgi:hypothetical protein